MDFFSLNLHQFATELMAQTPTPPTEVELLKQQLEFLKTTNAATNAQQVADFAEKLKFIAEDNKNLHERFSQFITTVQFVLGLFGFLGAFGGYWFGKSLKDSRELIREEVKARIANQVTDLVQSEVETVRRSLLRERVIGDTSVDYLCCSEQPPREVDLLRSRGFRSAQFHGDEVGLRTARGEIIVIDLYNWLQLNSGTPFEQLPDESQTRGQALISQVVDKINQAQVVVIYVKGKVKLPMQPNVVPANTWITLLGTVADAAHLVKAVKSSY
jgi:hypothetical protein